MEIDLYIVRIGSQSQCSLDLDFLHLFGNQE